MNEITSDAQKKTKGVHELLPKIPEKNGILLISFTLIHLQAKLITYLDDHQLNYVILKKSLKIEIIPPNSAFVDSILGWFAINPMAQDSV